MERLVNMDQVSECRPFLLLLWWVMRSLPGFHCLLWTVLMLTIHDYNSFSWHLMHTYSWSSHHICLSAPYNFSSALSSTQPPLIPSYFTAKDLLLAAASELWRWCTNQYSPRDENKHLCSSGGRASDDLSFLAFVLSVLSISQWVILTSPGFCLFWY